MKVQIIIFVSIISLLFSPRAAVYAEVIGLSPAPVNYTLPYPGLLPDSPLYFLKVLRDKILAFFISDPVKLSSFDILQSDKHTEASYFLITRENKIQLAESTFSKGENYFSDAISKADEAKSQGMDVADIVPQLVLSNQKHIEILSDIEESIPKGDSKLFVQDRLRLMQFGKEANALLLRK